MRSITATHQAHRASAEERLRTERRGHARLLAERTVPRSSRRCSNFATWRHPWPLLLLATKQERAHSATAGELRSIDPQTNLNTRHPTPAPSHTVDRAVAPRQRVAENAGAQPLRPLGADRTRCHTYRRAGVAATSSRVLTGRASRRSRTPRTRRRRRHRARAHLPVAAGSGRRRHRRRRVPTPPIALSRAAIRLVSESCVYAAFVSFDQMRFAWSRYAVVQGDRLRILCPGWYMPRR